VSEGTATAASSPTAFPTWARRVFQANLVLQIAIIVTGGVVRLTGSGLGCPTWPQCVPGSFTPVPEQEQAFHKYIEFGNRTLTFVLGVAALAAVGAAVVHLRTARREGTAARRPVVVLATLPLLGTIAQAVLGGITVLTDLNPAIVAPHLLLSLLIVGGCVVLVVRSGERGDQPFRVIVRREVRWAAWAALGLAAVVLVLGTIVTGSGPHSGDDSTHRLGLDPRTVAWLHADTVMLYVGVLVALLLALRVTGAPRRTQRAALLALLVALAQGLIGYTQYFTGLPWVVVACHLLGAALVWSATTYLLLSTRVRGPVSPTSPAG
jgi:cytochrome c oxidase assembly protein subunit 15